MFCLLLNISEHFSTVLNSMLAPKHVFESDNAQLVDRRYCKIFLMISVSIR